MASAQVVVIAVALLVGTVLIHYEAMQLAWRISSRTSSPSTRTDILKVILVLLLAHIVEIGLYAVVLLLCQHLGLGTLAGEIEGATIDWLYFSMSSYTTLGVGDLHPRGPLRLIAGVEALNGLVLIGWSASFTYLAMQEVWKSSSGEGGASMPRRLR
jgi:hypothetical protein